MCRTMRRRRWGTQKNTKNRLLWDNACIESFHSLIKREWLNRCFGYAFLHLLLHSGTNNRRRLRSSFNFDFSENRKVIRETESDNASRLWYNFYTSQFCKKSKNTVEKVKNVTEKQDACKFMGFPIDLIKNFHERT